MKGYATVASPYARKARIAAIETGQPDLIDWQMMTREERARDLPAINPLGKVPTVVLDDGALLIDSPVICAYIDAGHDGAKLIPDDGPERWRVLCLEALGDGLGEAVISIALERAKPEEAQAQRVFDRQGAKLAAALSALDGDAAGFRDPPSIGEIAVACALGYMEYRDVVPGWRDTHATLAAWYDAICARPSFQATLPDAAA